MKYALVNPRWDFEGSTYFGCAEPHFPLELLSAREMLRAAGQEVLLVDAWMEDLTPAQVEGRLKAFGEDFLVIPTAPSYLFWRCPPPELRVPKQWIAALGRRSARVVIGPHGSVTPIATLEKTGADIVLRGEPDQTLPQLASLPWEMIAGCCWRDPKGLVHATPGLGATDMRALGPLDYSDYPVERHHHLHHIFPGNGADHLRHGAEVEFARGCPYACTFCNKTLFRNKYRERELGAVLQEIDQLLSRGVDYIYFIDEIFGVGKQVRSLLEELAKRPVSIGFQSRIDLWNEEAIDLLARAHCVSFECGVESITDEGRDAMNKNCRISTDRITDLLVYAKQRIPWVQANLIKTPEDDPAQVAAWQASLKARGVWVSEPVPMFPFPGSPEYVTTFGAQPDERAWERAHAHYLALFADKGYSDIQDQRPLTLAELESQEHWEPPVRILLTTDTIGGIWTFTRELSAGLLRRGHSVALVSFGRAPSKEQTAWCATVAREYANTFRFEFSTVPLEWMRSNHAAYTQAKPLLQCMVAEFGPDLLHTNQFCFGSLPIAIPRLVTAHSDVLSWAASCRPDSLVPSKWLTQYRSLVQTGLDGADVIVAPTRWMLDALRDHFEVLSSAHVIANGRKLPPATVVETQKLQAVSVGRLWDEAKNLSLLTHIDPPLPIFVAGERQHENFCVNSPLGSVTLLGALTESELLRLFRQSSIYLASSIYEPFGLAPLEAALCGCAVVANDLLSLREVWGDAALYFQDAASLMHLLHHLQSSPAALRRAQQNASRRAVQLSASRMTEAYLRLYAGLLAPKPQPGSVLQEFVTDAV